MGKIMQNCSGFVWRIALLPIALLFIAAITAACGTVSTDATPEPAAAVETELVVAEAEAEAPESSVYPLTVTDELGHEVILTAKPAKIFAPVMEDSLAALGVKPVIQWSNGVEPQLYLQDRLGDVPEISFGGGIPASEAVLAYEPDLIILHNSFYADNGVYEQYAKIAPTYAFKNASTDLKNAIRVLGELLDEPDKAAQAQSSYDEKVQAAKARLGTLPEGKKAALIRFNAKGMFFMNANYYSGYVLVHELGFEQSGLVQNGALEVSFEILPELDADYIFLINDGNLGDAFLTELKESAIWQAVPAVRNGQVFETTSDYWLSGGYIAQAKVIDDVLGFLAP